MHESPTALEGVHSEIFILMGRLVDPLVMHFVATFSKCFFAFISILSSMPLNFVNEMFLEFVCCLFLKITIAALILYYGQVWVDYHL